MISTCVVEVERGDAASEAGVELEAAGRGPEQCTVQWRHFVILIFFYRVHENKGKTYRPGLEHSICETLMSHCLLVVFEKVKVKVAVPVAAVPISAYTMQDNRAYLTKLLYVFMLYMYISHWLGFELWKIDRSFMEDDSGRCSEFVSCRAYRGGPCYRHI